VIDPHGDADLFWATAGGMGLTGVITEATLRLVPLRTPWFETVTWRTEVLGETLRILDRSAHQHAMAWVDPCAPSDRMGRGVITCGEPALAEAGHSHASLARSANGLSDWGPPVGVMRPALIRLASTSFWRMAAPGPTERTARLGAFLFPFDRLGSWNRLFGPRGLIQWQGVVPRGSEDALADLLATYRRHEVVSPLVSLKRLGPGNAGPLSFPIDGWTVAIDLPAAAPDLGVLLGRLDSITAHAGGRVYLAKDSRLRPGTLREMYPRFEEWCAVRRRADPAGLMCSDLARRLHLLEDEA
jgi:decaprenylphospho-beta-D-ribofuranose 2-oxidase